MNLLRNLVIAVCLVIYGCRESSDKKIFAIRHGKDIGIDFQNTITTNDTLNALSFEYIYNGSGVGVGDFNSDGLGDIFFGGNQVSGRLYLNEGKLKFKDVTEAAGVLTDKWITGVSVIDINMDGRDDLYLCVAGKTSANERRNILFVNEGISNGVPHFVESSSEYGLDDDAYSTMAAFFDYDKDGDPDMYLLNNWLEQFNRNNARPIRQNGQAESTDHLYRNNGNNTFTDVSREAGILIEGYGLGVNICDINQDSWPDVYVSNDFMSNDLLWINQQDGTFKNKIGDYVKHLTHNGMGVDIADFNNDALADILVVDMLPPGHTRQKMMTPGQNYDHFHISLDLGYEPQYMRNTLQLNRGKVHDGRILFSEIAFQAGVAQTDWSWAPLFADFDNDGWKDIFIANGYRRDVTNLDFIFFGMEQNPFGTSEARKKKLAEEFRDLPDVKLTNYIYRNNGSLIFEDKTREWGVELPTFSNGAAYADLDNDGDLDLVTNNIDQEVILYENTLNERENKNHYLRLVADDPGSATEKIRVYAGGKSQYFERTPYRGFQSTVEGHVHVGMGTSTLADSIIISWPDNYELYLTSFKTDTVLKYTKKNARLIKRNPHAETQPLFETLPLIDYQHKEKSPSDVKTVRTLSHELSRYGPCLAKGDVNGDSLDDFFIGEEYGSPSRIFIQQKDGTFTAAHFSVDSIQEVGAALFFDADNDNDQDLYVAACAPSGQAHTKEHQLYLNDGTGDFSVIANAIPEITTSASCVEGADYDNDGDIDLFIGGRIKSSAYPFSPRSYLLQNENGKFRDVTHQLSPALVEPGMVSSAAWADINNDKKQDLIITGEWQPIRIFLNESDRLTEETEKYGLGKTHGWWNCITVGDVNDDGFADIVAGNTGRNSYFKPTAEHPVTIYAKDFDSNGSVDPIVTYFNPIEKDRFIVHNRLVLIDQIPAIKRKFETFTQYATTPFGKVFADADLKGAFVGNAYKLESVILINRRGRDFEMQDLPDIAQISTINDIILEDVNHDGAADIIAIGNMYAQETLYGRYDASVGTVLLGNNQFSWKALNPAESGMTADGDVRYIESLKTPSGKMTVISCNNDKLQFYRLVNATRFLGSSPGSPGPP
jgi:enediyne biosynthesis protein E4